MKMDNMIKKVIGDKVHVWNRKSHQIWQDGKLISSNAMLPCPYEKNGECREGGNDHHKTHFYHYAKKIQGKTLFFDPISKFLYISTDPHYHTDKIVCKYQHGTCWEKYNGIHIKYYHHI